MRKVREARDRDRDRVIDFLLPVTHAHVTASAAGLQVHSPLRLRKRPQALNPEPQTLNRTTEAPPELADTSF